MTVSRRRSSTDCERETPARFDEGGIARVVSPDGEVALAPSLLDATGGDKHCTDTSGKHVYVKEVCKGKAPRKKIASIN